MIVVVELFEDREDGSPRRKIGEARVRDVSTERFHLADYHCVVESEGLERPAATTVRRFDRTFFGAWALVQQALSQLWGDPVMRAARRK